MPLGHAMRLRHEFARRGLHIAKMLLVRVRVFVHLELQVSVDALVQAGSGFVKPALLCNHS